MVWHPLQSHSRKIGVSCFRLVFVGSCRFPGMGSLPQPQEAAKWRIGNTRRRLEISLGIHCPCPSQASPAHLPQPTLSSTHPSSRGALLALQGMERTGNSSKSQRSSRNKHLIRQMGKDEEKWGEKKEGTEAIYQHRRAGCHL